MLLVTVINVTSTPDIMVLRIALRASRVFRAHGSGNVIVYSEYASSAIWLILRPVALEAGSPKPFSRVFFFFFFFFGNNLAHKNPPKKPEEIILRNVCVCFFLRREVSRKYCHDFFFFLPLLRISLESADALQIFLLSCCWQWIMRL